MAHMIEPMPKAGKRSKKGKKGKTGPAELIGSAPAPATGREVDAFEQEERESMELAFNIATVDPTERDHVTSSVKLASRRLRRAITELVRAFFALAAILVVRILLSAAAPVTSVKTSRNPSKIAKIGQIGKTAQITSAPHRMIGAKKSVFSLHALLHSLGNTRGIPYATTTSFGQAGKAGAGGKVARITQLKKLRANRACLAIIMILGGRRSSDPQTPGTSQTNDDSAQKQAVSLKLAERTYRTHPRNTGLGHNAEKESYDSPVVRVILGVRVEKGETPVYRIRRFIANEDGRYDELAGYHSEDHNLAWTNFASEPALEALEDLGDLGDSATVEESKIEETRSSRYGQAA